MLPSMSDEPIVLNRAEAPRSARTSFWGTNPETGPVRASEQRDQRIRFDRPELKRILNTYGRMVMAGEWRDYAIDFRDEVAVFSVFRRASEMPLYSIEKRPRLKDRQGQYSVVAAGGQVLKRGHDLSAVLRVLERKLLKAVAAE
jgi:Protein of unknown function (DUF2794)